MSNYVCSLLDVEIPMSRIEYFKTRVMLTIVEFFILTVAMIAVFFPFTNFLGSTFSAVILLADFIVRVTTSAKRELSAAGTKSDIWVVAIMEVVPIVNFLYFMILCLLAESDQPQGSCKNG